MLFMRKYLNTRILLTIYYLTFFSTANFSSLCFSAVNLQSSMCSTEKRPCIELPSMQHETSSSLTSFQYTSGPLQLHLQYSRCAGNIHPLTDQPQVVQQTETHMDMPAC